MTYDEVRDLLDQLENRRKLKNSDLMLYFVLPFLKGLGYDMYNLDEVYLDIEGGNVTVKVDKDLEMYLTLIETEKLFLEEDVKIYVSMDIEERIFKLSYKVLNKWEEIVTINLEGQEENKDLYVSHF